MQEVVATPYDQGFFDAQAFESLQSARVVLPELLRHIRPQSVIDVGCGVGSWLQAAGDLGIPERLGVDGDYVDRAALMIPADLFVPADLSLPGLADTVATRRPGRFDLVMCLEVAEHLAFERSAGLVHDLCLIGDIILFSAAVPFQHGTGHINEQWPEYWATQFRAHSYSCFDLLRPEIWGRPGVNWWYAQNTLVFVRQDSEAHAWLPSVADAGHSPLAYVHPEAWLSGALSVWHQHRGAARIEEQQDFRALRQAWMYNESLIPPLRAHERARTALPGTRDVFPYTRLDTAEPEQLIAAAKVQESAAQAAVAATTQECAGMRREMDAAVAHAAALQAEHDAGRLRADALSAELAEATSALARHFTRLAAVELHLATLQTANTALRGHTAVYEQALADLSPRAAMARPLQQEITALRHEVAEAKEAAVALARQGAELQHWLDMVHASTSWRVTAPLRAVRLLLNRGG